MIREIPDPPADPCGQGSGLGQENVKAALDKVIHSKTLRESSRLRVLLEFIVKNSLSGNSSALKEMVLGVEIFGKPHDFDPRLDASVRVAVNRLRAKLKSYYETEGASESILIELPEGHYIPKFSFRRTVPSLSGNDQFGSGHYPFLQPSRAANFEARTFVGRQAELEQLRNHMARAVEGHGHMVSIVSEPGIGKTALIEAFLGTQHNNDRLMCAIGRCRQELEHTESYLPWIEVLEDIAGRESPPDALLQTSAPTWWNRLRVQKPDACVQQESSVKREMQRFLQAFTNRQPLLLVLEDLHWADTSTVDLISFLGPSLASLRLLLLVSYRPSGLALAASPFLKVEPELKMHRICEDMALGELSPDDTQHYLDLRSPGHSFPHDLLDHLHSRSEGNALCLTAMVDCALERGWICSRGGRWEMVTSLDRWDTELPPSVRSMVGVKLGILSRPDRELLSAGAVYGTEFDTAVLAHALHLDGASVEEGLAVLEGTHRLVRKVGDVRLLFGVANRYQFAHALYREALLNTVEPARHRTLCSHLAGALIACHGDANPALTGNVARLLSEAGAGEAALPYYARAAAYAVQLSAYRQALDLGIEAADIAGRCVPSEAVRRLEIEFLTVQALSLTALEGFAASAIEQLYARARQVAQDLRDPTAATSIAHLHWGPVSIANMEKARDLADVLWNDAAASQNLEARALARMAQGIARFHLGMLADGSLILADAAGQWHRFDRTLGFRSYMLDPAVATECNLARALWFIGKPDQAWRTALDTVELASRIGHQRTIAYALALAADVAHLRRDPAATLEWCARAGELAREHEFLYEAAWARILQAWALAQNGDLAQAADIFQFVSQYRGPGATKVLCHFAEVLGKQRCYDRAQSVLDDAFRVAAERGERYYASELERIAGEIAMRSDGEGGIARAEHMLRKAVLTARQSQAVSCELRAASSLARFCLEFRPACSREAMDELRDVVDSLPETGETPDRADALRLLQGIA